MPTLVQKYGGSSLADTEKLKYVARRIVDRKRAGVDVVVVVSAMGDTTDRLLAMAREVAKDPSRRELDMLLTVGERITMALLSMMIHELGQEVISLTGSQCGILTSDSHSRARIMEVRPFRVQDELAKGRIVIVAGYQGTSYKREITTLGRGGSDLTAVALAAALNAEACEIYSDVDGVLTGDPRIVPSATQIETLSYDEMLALSKGGARVLHADAVEWARRTGVALYARSTQGEGTGTMVRRDLPERPNPVVAVTGRTDLVRVSSTNAAPISARLSDVPIAEQWSHGEHSQWILCREDTPEMDALCEELLGMGASVERETGSVMVVGHALSDDPQASTVLRTAFEGYSNHANVLSWTAWLPAALVDDLVGQLHAQLIEHSA
ncbi:MAG TPA: aspartate kinase [Myxococcales bacterium]|nr:aspartate kinase [Myxococcales bacterium]